jgi:hypothetical protein
MTPVTVGSGPHRVQLRLRSRTTLADDLGLFGRVVGPRRGPDARTHGSKEDYCLRRWLVAMTAVDRLRFPVTVTSGAPDRQEPDFIIHWARPDDALGLEVTEAGQASWQAWLSKTEGRPGPSFLMDNEDGYGGDEPERLVVRDIQDAIRRKLTKRRQGAYSATPHCDLLIYENSEGGLLCDRAKVIRQLISRRVGELSEAGRSFDGVHLLFGDDVHLDLFGNERVSINVAEQHADDWSAWLLKQAEHLRRRDLESIDFDNLAEELEGLGRSDQRALRSHLLVLLLCLLKWERQPDKRSRSWQNSILSAREEIEDLLKENPSFENKFLQFVEGQFSRAVALAAKETGIEISKFPNTSPYSVDQIRDRDFWPGGPAR